jgi:peptide/nickel transport system substrate-binding protein
MKATGRLLGSGSARRSGEGPLPRRRPVIAIAMPVVFALVLSACTKGGGGGGANGGPIQEGGTLRIGTSSGLISPNPFVGFNQDDYSTWMYIYPSLLQYDTTTPGYSYIPGFAQDWSRSSDGLTVTFHTTPGATWSDGEPLTADDVASTFNMIKQYADGPAAAWSGSVTFLKSIEATDANTLVATYDQPSGTALFDLGLTPILPPQVWQQYATGDGKGLKTFPNEPANGEPLVGGGPFIMTEYRKNDIALFEKNPNYYGTQPHIDGFGLQFFRDEDAMVTALKTDQLDAINEIPPTSVDTLRSAGMQVYTGPALSLRDFIFNVDPNKTQHRELLNPSVREAFEYAIDRDSIVQTAWVGYAAPGSTIIPAGNATDGVQWHDPSIQPLPFDIAKANQMLDSLGYRKGSDGVRIADGHPMAYEVVFPQDEEGAGDRAFQIIQQDFKQIGVELTQKRLDDNAAWNAMYCGGQCGYNFDLAMWDWFPAADPDFILNVLTCHEYGNWNDTGYCNPAYDKLYTEQKGTVDPQARQQIVYQMQQLAAKDRPYIILTYDERLDAWSPSWEGFVPSTQGIFNNFSTQSLTSVHQA